MEASTNVHFHADATPTSRPGKIPVTPCIHSTAYTFILSQMKIVLTVAWKYLSSELWDLQEQAIISYSVLGLSNWKGLPGHLI